MTIVPIYRISDFSNPEKVKPDYASKENCLKNFVREFGKDNLYVICDKVVEETYNMVCKYADKEKVFLSQNGNTGTFLASLELAKNLLKQVEDDRRDEIIFYFVECGLDGKFFCQYICNHRVTNNWYPRAESIRRNSASSFHISKMRI